MRVVTFCSVLSIYILGLLLGSQYLPGVMSWCWQDAAVHCSQVSVGDTAQARDRVSWQCHESARMSCCHESDRHLWWCLLVSQHCILLWHLPTLTTLWWWQDTRYLSPQIFISECVSNRFLLLLAGKMFVWTTVFLFTLYLRLAVSTITTIWRQISIWISWGSECVAHMRQLCVNFLVGLCDTGPGRGRSLSWMLSWLQGNPTILAVIALQYKIYNIK